MPKMRAGTRPSVGDALYYALSRLSPRSEGSTAQARAKDLVKRAGSVRAAAEMAGVSPETMRRWRSGTQGASGANAEKLATAQRSARFRPKQVEKLLGSAHKADPDATDAADRAPEAPPGGGLRVKARIEFSSDERVRWINVGSEIPRRAMKSILWHLVHGDPDAAEAELVTMINLHYFGDGETAADAQVTEVMEIRY